MAQQAVGAEDPQSEGDPSRQAAWQIQLQWFSSVGLLEIRLRWLAALGVLAATWLARSVLGVPLASGPLYGIGVAMLAYNGLLWWYLNRRLAVPSRTRVSGYDYGALVRYFWRQLESGGIAESRLLDRLVRVQTSLDWLAMILLVHFSGGIESPLLFFFIFHLIIAAILLPRRECYLFATLAAVAVGGLALLEYGGVVPHVALGILPAPLYQNGLYVASILFFFTTTLYTSVFLTTSITSSLRQRDEELLRLQDQLSDAYELIQTLYEVTRTVSSTLDLDEVLKLIARNAAESMQVQACAILLVREREPIVDRLVAYGFGGEVPEAERIDLRESAYLLETYSDGRPTIVVDTRQDRFSYPDGEDAEAIRSVLCVPLAIRGKTVGLVSVYARRQGHFVESDAEFLSALASAGATAVENARAYQALEAADRAKSEFVRMVSHELRSPLSAVQSMLRLMEQGLVGPLTAKQQDLVERSQRRITMLLSMVGDLLELAAGKLELLRGERKSVDLAPIVAKVADLLRASAEEKELRFTVDLGDEPLTLTGLEDALERMILNLVSNAVKYTPAGGNVEVRARRQAGQIEITVRDTGIGIPEEALPRIFSEFYRARNAKALAVEGTGLGLAIAKDVVEQHGGTVTVESQVGRGTTFRVTLPSG